MEVVAWLFNCSIVLIIAYALVEFKIRSKTKRYITENKLDPFNNSYIDYIKSTQ
jgi:hypothetical protein